ncbi:MAG: translation initiation factor IF-5A, partial [Deltaproteobacteria bacterium]|nr:translation initiation factor IF-5A [Deltaproteobacteria bacterium]
GEPCRVTSFIKSKPGKHGAAKVRLEGAGLFDNKKRVLMKPADSNVNIPVIEKKKAQVLSVSGDIAQLMDLDSYETFDASVPEDLKGKLDSGVEVIYWQFESKLQIKEIRS